MRVILLVLVLGACANRAPQCTCPTPVVDSVRADTAWRLPTGAPKKCRFPQPKGTEPYPGC